MMNRGSELTTEDSTYAGLYRLAGAAALAVALLVLIEVVLFAIYPQPATVSAWFALFQTNWLLGWIDIWGLEILMYVMFIPVFLALYVLLRKTAPSLVLIALTLALLGVGVFLSTNNPFSMLSLASQYAVARTEAERAAFMGAGQALLAGTGQRTVGGFNVGLFLVSAAGLIVSYVMLRTRFFSRPFAYLGVFAFALSLLDYVRQGLTSSPLIALLVILPNALLLVLWYILLGRALVRLGPPGTEEIPGRSWGQAVDGLSR